MNPRNDCAIVLEPHAQDRRILRGLPYVDMEKMIREGDWEEREDGLTDINSGKWGIRIKIGKCTISVVTLFK